MAYLLGALPTNAKSALYGLAQPFGQPVILINICSLFNLNSLKRESIESNNASKTRSLSARARPQVGRATHACAV